MPADEPRPLAVKTSLTFPLVDPITVENLGMPLLDIVDLVLGSSDGPVIADFKTAAKSNDPLEVTHEVQLSCYAYLFRHMAGRFVYRPGWTCSMCDYRDTHCRMWQA